MRYFPKLWAYFFVTLFLFSISSHAQSVIFAELTGNPLNTTGWNLVGEAALPGSITSLDTVGKKDELVLAYAFRDTNDNPMLKPTLTTVTGIQSQWNRNVPFRNQPLKISGGVFYNKSLDLSNCNKWTVTFQYRIYDGTELGYDPTPADGLAFCFLPNPPTSFTTGGGLGLPPNSLGLAVAFDTYNNSNCNGIEIRSGNGNTKYTECGGYQGDATYRPINLRSNTYNQVKITYSNGFIAVYYNDTVNPILTTTIPKITYSGFFGITAATGGHVDNHSIKNFKIFIPKPVQLAYNPGAGGNKLICAGDSTQIGVPSKPGYTYKWSPATGLNNPNISNPTVSYNYGLGTTTRNYFLTVDSVVPYGLTCAVSPSMTLTVIGKGAQGAFNGETIGTFCQGNPPYTVNFQGETGFQYSWKPSAGLSDSTISSPAIPIINNTNSAINAKYVVTATYPGSGCSDKDSLYLSILPSVTTAGPDFSMCSGDTVNIGSETDPNAIVFWQPIGGNGITYKLLSSGLPLRFTAVNNTTSPVNIKLALTASTLSCGTTNDTVQVTVYPRKASSLFAGKDTSVCAGTKLRLGIAPLSGARYKWSPAAFLSNDTIAQPFYAFQKMGQDTSLLALQVSYGTCSYKDTVRVITNAVPKVNVAPGISICSGSTAIIGVKQDSTAKFKWLPSSGLMYADSAISPISLMYTGGNLLTIQNIHYILQITGQDGCQVYDTVQVQVRPYAVTNAGPDTVLCGNGILIQLTNPSTGSFTWLKSFQGVTDTIKNNQIAALATQTYVNDSVRLILNSSLYGCYKSDTALLVIKPLPVKPLIPALTLCSGIPDSFQVVSDSKYSYQWSPTNGLSNGLTAKSAINLSFNRDDTLQYVLIVAYQGCRTYDTAIVYGHPLPLPVQVFGPRSVCPQISNIPYRIIQNQPGVSYQWQVNGGNIATGNGGDTIKINWGPANDSASVKVVPLSSSGCSSDTTVFKVSISKVLKTATPVTDTNQICLFNASRVSYSTYRTPGSKLTWEVSSNGIILSQNPDTTGNIYVDWTTSGSSWVQIIENNNVPVSATDTIKCQGASDSLKISILNSPDTTLTVLFNGADCSGDTLVFRLNGSPGSYYSWKVNFNNGSDSLKNKMGLTTIDTLFSGAGTGSVWVKETTSSGCPGKWIGKTFVVNSNPQPQWAKTTSSVCPQNVSAQVYSVKPVSGYQYTWQVTGGTIASVSDADSVVINWQPDTSYKKVSLALTDVNGCKAGLYWVPTSDFSYLQLYRVSVLEQDPTQIELSYALHDSANNPNNIQVIRNDGIQYTVPKSSDYLIDEQVNTSSNSYGYYLTANNLCGFPLTTGLNQKQQSVKVSARGQEGTETIVLSWNPYINWPLGVDRYEIYRTLDGGQATLFTTLSPDSIGYATPTALEGFEHCFRVKAIQKGGNEYSWSQWACDTFQHPLIVYNVITPNNDSKNDVWKIEHLHLYPNNEVFIYNRWGRLVYNKSGYPEEGEWSGDGVPDGVYFYQINTGKNNYQVKGWVQVLR